MRNSSSRVSGLSQRLGRAFALQVLAIAAAAVVGVWAAAFTIEELLIERALEEEADHYWALRRDDPAVVAPNTRNLRGYLVEHERHQHLPLELRALSDGFHHLSTDADATIVYLTRQGAERLILVFNGEQVRELSAFFGLAPLGLVLAVIYLVAWLSYRAARRAASPVEWLAREVRDLDPQRPDPQVFAAERLPGRPDREVVALAEALGRLATSVNEFLERERLFTRDASHELRSPLTVIRLAADMLLTEQELSHPAKNSVRRIKRSATDMEDLTQAFLLLARDSEQGLSADRISVNDVVREEAELAGILAAGRPVSIRFVEECRLDLVASDKVISVLVGNLLRNAVNYTEEGEVVARIGTGFVEISDSGAGIPRHEVAKVFEPFYRVQSPAPTEVRPQRPRPGHGVGLTIVKRITDRFQWPIRIESEPGRGTRVLVEFPQAECRSLSTPTDNSSHRLHAEHISSSRPSPHP